MERVRDFPGGISPPRKVRIYLRGDRYHLLQWWDSSAKRTLSERVDGDLIEAIARARQIDERLLHFRSSGHKCRRVGHQELVDGYLTDLNRRADAGEIDPRTVVRYSSALRNHYLTYALRPDVERQFRHIATVNRDFELGFAAFLTNSSVRPNGHPTSKLRPMRGQNYEMDVVRGMFEWAAAPDGGNLLPEGFRNPFVRRSRRRCDAKANPCSDPDISIQMAVDFVSIGDIYQLRLFAPIILYGLRATEPAFVFREDLDDGWLNILCRPGLAYMTKGRRDKRLPLVPSIHTLLQPAQAGPPKGLLYLRRNVAEGKEKPGLRGKTLNAVVDLFQQHCAQAKIAAAAGRRRVRDRILKEAGGITYNHVVTEFRKLARQLGWPAEATLKDFRHLFATSMQNAGMPEHYRKYLMGHSAGRGAIVIYTHLNEVRQRYGEAVERTMQPVVGAIVRRSEELGIHNSCSDL